jgi:hypothetical protein
MLIPPEVIKYINANLPAWEMAKEITWNYVYKRKTYQIVRVPSENGLYLRREKKGFLSLFTGTEVVNYNYYLVNLSKSKGKGSYGEVFKAFLYDPNTKNIDKKNPRALKIYTNPDIEEAMEEARNERKTIKLLHSDPPLKVQNRIYFFMEWVPGKTPNKHPKFKKLTFYELTEALWQLAFALYTAHNNTIQDGGAIVHADLKLENIKISIKDDPDNKNKKKISLRLLDFGIAEKISDNPNILTMQTPRGTVINMSPEPLRGEFTVKTDIFLFFIILIHFYGGDPLKERNELINPTVMDIVNTELNFENLFTGINIPNFAYDISSIITKLARRGGALNCEERLDSDETFNALNALRLLCLCHQQNPKGKDSKYIYFAKLNLIAAGLWKNAIGKKTIEVFKNKKLTQKRKDRKNIEITWQGFGFDTNPKVCLAINLLSNKDLLSKESSQLLTYGLLAQENESSPQPEYAAQAVIKLHSENLLDDKILNKLIEDPKNCERIIVSSSFKIAHLFLISDSTRKAYVENLKKKEQFKIYDHILKNRAHYNEIFSSPLTIELLKSISNVMLKKVDDYRVKKSKLPPDKYERTKRGYTNIQKEQAANLLIKTFSEPTQANINAFFQPENKISRKALEKKHFWISRLGDEANDFVTYLEKNKSAIPSPG